MRTAVLLLICTWTSVHVLSEEKCSQDDLAVVARNIETGGVLGSHLVGFLNLVSNSVYGSDLVKFLSEKGNKTPQSLAQDLLNAKFLVPKSGSTKFSSSSLYQLVHKTGEETLNTKELDICTTKSAVELVEDIRNIMSQLFASFLTADGKKVDYEGITSSPLWSQYKNFATQLQRVKVETLSDDQKLAFFINIYNILCIHGLIEKGVPSNLLARFQFYKDTSYVIGGHVMSLNEIENGILRSNRASGGTLFLKPFSKDDPRLKLSLPEADARIHFALNCGAKSCPPLRVYDGKDVDNQLDVATNEYLDTSEGLQLEDAKNSVQLSKLFEWYKVDFGETNQEVLRWVLNYLQDTQKKEAVGNILRKGGVKLSFIDYDWGHNGL